MPISENINSLEEDKFVETNDGYTAVRVMLVDSSGSGDDHHSGFYLAPDGTVISQNKQSVTFGTLDLDGIIYINGQLILES